MRLFQNIKKKAAGFTLVELMIVVAIIGILAAIAIPAFVRYIKSSKAAESEGIMRKFADGAKGYFTSEQRYALAAGGDQPWHAAGAIGSDSGPGLPVPGAAYVFPGGSNCTLVTSTTVPSGGAKTVPAISGCGTFAAAALNKMNVTIEDALYFQYTYAALGASNAATVTLTAIANFDGDTSTANHTGTMFVAAQSGGDVAITPMSLVNEFL